MSANASEFGNVLQKRGYKLTSQRQAVMQIILDNKEKHLTAEEILDEVKKINPGIGLATVYRALRLFEKNKFVQHISLDDGIMRYEMADPEEKHEHHHLICQICGDVIDVEEDMLDLVEEKLFLEKGFRVSNHRLQFFGICSKCAKKLQSKENRK